jgi:uncharacterized protein YndB with AHSA1/START domain
MHPVRHIAFTNEVGFARPREEVFEAFLDTGQWLRSVTGRSGASESSTTAASAPDL